MMCHLAMLEDTESGGGTVWLEPLGGAQRPVAPVGTKHFHHGQPGPVRLPRPAGASAAPELSDSANMSVSILPGHRGWPESVRQGPHRPGSGLKFPGRHRESDIAAVQVRGPLDLRGEKGTALALLIPRLSVVPTCGSSRSAGGGPRKHQRTGRRRQPHHPDVAGDLCHREPAAGSCDGVALRVWAYQDVQRPLASACLRQRKDSGFWTRRRAVRWLCFW
jgi:hypothetical protein